jgi:hypothetical protein
MFLTEYILYNNLQRLPHVRKFPLIQEKELSAEEFNRVYSSLRNALRKATGSNGSSRATFPGFVMPELIQSRLRDLDWRMRRVSNPSNAYLLRLTAEARDISRHLRILEANYARRSVRLRLQALLQVLIQRSICPPPASYEMLLSGSAFGTHTASISVEDVQRLLEPDPVGRAQRAVHAYDQFVPESCSMCPFDHTRAGELAYEALAAIDAAANTSRSAPMTFAHSNRR